MKSAELKPTKSDLKAAEKFAFRRYTFSTTPGWVAMHDGYLAGLLAERAKLMPLIENAAPIVGRYLGQTGSDLAQDWMDEYDAIARHCNGKEGAK